MVDVNVQGQEPTQTQTQTQAGDDPFQVDETALASLAPEQRQALEPMFTTWKTRAQEIAEAKVEAERAKYQGYDEHVKKSGALDQLVKNPQFVEWYQKTFQQNGQQNAAARSVASPQEWNEALVGLANNDPAKWLDLNQRQMMAMANPIVSQLRQEQMEIKTQQDVDALFRRHPDAEELNAADENGVSLLEAVTHEVVDLRKGSMEQAYEVAKRIADQYRAKAKGEALNLVKDKKTGVTEGGVKNAGDKMPVVQANDSRDQLRKQILANIRGQKVLYDSKRKVLAE